VTFVWQQLGSTVNTKRVALWGTSFAGGHVIVTAATVAKNVSCIVSQIPFLDGRATLRAIRSKQTHALMFRTMFAAVRDRARQLIGLQPVYIPLISSFSDAAVITVSNEVAAMYKSRIPTENSGGWQNKVPASILLELPFYRPIDFIVNVTCPILILEAGSDSINPKEALDIARKLVPAATVKTWNNVDHLEMSAPPVVDDAIGAMIEFLNGCLR
jgi:pimeloyl-ACP methyl ester carboxylesterase